jgi:hypothetical protein
VKLNIFIEKKRATEPFDREPSSDEYEYPVLSLSEWEPNETISTYEMLGKVESEHQNIREKSQWLIISVYCHGLGIP